MPKTILIVTTLFLSVSSHADYGVAALRVLCSDKTDLVEIKLFMAWNAGNSPHKEYGADDANRVKIVGSERYHPYIQYSYDHFGGGRFITDTCARMDDRYVSVFVDDDYRLTITENNHAPVQALPIGGIWKLAVSERYVLRSTKEGEWSECLILDQIEKPICNEFDPSEPFKPYTLQQKNPLNPNFVRPFPGLREYTLKRRIYGKETKTTLPFNQLH